MRLLTVTHFFESHGGGIERVAGHLCRQFALLGAEPVWAASDSDPAPEGEVEVVPLGCIDPLESLTGLPMPIPGPHALRRLAHEVRRSDVVVVHDALYVTSIVALLMAKGYDKRVILIQHIAGIPFSSRVMQLLMAVAIRIVTRPMLWAANVRVFISDNVRHDLLGSPPRNDYVLLFNGVDTTIFHPGASTRSLAEIRGGARRQDGRNILFVGRYVEKKGLAVLRALAAARADLHFFLAGKGPIRPGEWGLANIHDLGVQTPMSLADLYRSVDLLLLPSVGEGYPLVVQEAMACGLPVICGEPTNRADPGASAYLHGVEIDLSDLQGSALRCGDAIDGLRTTTAERAEMAQYAAQRYSWEAMAQSIIGLARDQRAATLI